MDTRGRWPCCHVLTRRTKFKNGIRIAILKYNYSFTAGIGPYNGLWWFLVTNRHAHGTWSQVRVWAERMVWNCTREIYTDISTQGKLNWWSKHGRLHSVLIENLLSRSSWLLGLSRSSARGVLGNRASAKRRHVGRSRSWKKYSGGVCRAVTPYIWPADSTGVLGLGIVTGVRVASL